MAGLRRLKRKGANRYLVEPLHRLTQPCGKKLSAVILDFAEPLTKDVDDDHFGAAITLAILCWNIALLPEDEQQRELRAATGKMAKGKPAWWVRDLGHWTQRLLDRRKRLFGHDRRMVVNYTISDEGDDFHLYVASTFVPDSLPANP